MFIPITLLVGLTLLPFGSFGHNRAATFVPVIMALAVISTAFTGQAIAVAFDRRYGALKRLGAPRCRSGESSPASHWRWSLPCSCSRSSWAPSGLRSAGDRRWRRWFSAPLIIALGTAAFAALGLLLGGTLKAEIVLAVANLMWFVFAGLGALTVETRHGPAAVQVGRPPHPVGRADRGAVAGDELSVDWFGIAVLVAWGALAALAALRWFRFT